MSRRSERAKELFLEGYNCAQAVVAAFSDVFPMEFDALMKTISSFGGGMGRLREVCGAVSGMFFVAGALHGYDEPKATDEKKEHYRLIQTLAEFEKHGFRMNGLTTVNANYTDFTTGKLKVVPAIRMSLN